MNIYNLNRVIEMWEKLDPVHVDMESWFNYNDSELSSVSDIDDCNVDFTGSACGTTACLAGHIQFKFAEGNDRNIMAELFARDFLKISSSDGEALFTEGEYYGYGEADLYEQYLDDDKDHTMMALVTHQDVLDALRGIRDRGGEVFE